MAVRLRLNHQEDVRRKIQAVQLVNFVQAYALTGLDVMGQEVNPARIQAAKILLDKTVATLSSTELTGDPEHPVQMKAVVEFVNADPATKGA